MICIECKTVIPDDANICRQCRSHQTKLGNLLPHIGTVLALVTFILAGFSYIAEKALFQFKELTAKDGINVVFLDSEGNDGFINTGDKDVILMDVDITLNQVRMSTSVDIFKRVAPNEFISVEEKSDEDWIMDSETMRAENPRDAKFSVSCFNKGNSILKSNKEYFPYLKTYPATGVLTYYSTIDKKQKTLNIECECVAIRPKSQMKQPENK